jgi:hypothetical protein
MKLATWIKVSATELGVSVGDFYKRINTGETIDRFMVIVLLGQWRLTIDQIIEKAARISYILTGFYRRIPFEQMKTPFLDWPFDKYVAFMTGRKVPTKEERDAAKAARYEEDREKPPVITPSDAEKEIVSFIKKGLDAKPVGVNDLSHIPYLQKAQLAYRRELTDIAYEKNDPMFYGTGKICKDVTSIRTLADAKFLFKLHLSEGVPHKLIRNCVCARIEDDPELAEQRQALGYKNTHDYLTKELKVDFDTYRAIQIGRNYLKYEATILSYLGNIDSEVKLSMLINFDKAIANHGDQPELIARFLRPETLVADWDAFAIHRDYEQYLSEKRMSPAKVKEARRIIFDFHEAIKKAEALGRKPVGIAGDKMCIFPIVLDEEKSFLDRCLRDLEYLNKYVQKYAWYKANGFLS